MTCAQKAVGSAVGYWLAEGGRIPLVDEFKSPLDKTQTIEVGQELFAQTFNLTILFPIHPATLIGFMRRRAAGREAAIDGHFFVKTHELPN